MAHMQKTKDDLDNTFLCVMWLIEEFKKMQFFSIAQIFQRALDDSISMVNNMSTRNDLVQEYNNHAEIREAQVIRAILVKYASIHDPERRELVLKKMQLATQSSDKT